MPNYLFEDASGCRHEVFMDCDSLRKKMYKKDGVRGDYIEREIAGEVVELKRLYVPFGAPASSVWPKRSMSMGVSVDQIEEATKADRENGVRVDYDPRTGDAIHTSMNQRRQHMKLLQMVDKDSFI